MISGNRHRKGMIKHTHEWFPMKDNPLVSISSEHQPLHQQGLAGNWPGPSLRAHVDHLANISEPLDSPRLRHRQKSKNKGLWPHSDTHFWQTKCIWQRLEGLVFGNAGTVLPRDFWMSRAKVQILFVLIGLILSILVAGLNFVNRPYHNKM